MKILIRLPNWLGDVVMSTAFVGAVRQLYPLATIDVIIKKELADVAQLIPGINRVHLFSKQEHKGLRGLFHFGRALRRFKYDIFFNLPQSFSSSFLARVSFAKKRVGFNKEGGFMMLTNCYNRPPGMHRVDEYMYLLERFSGTKVTDRKVKLLPGKSVIHRHNKVIVNFNSEAISRRMPLHNGRTILLSLLRAFPDRRFVLIGSPKEAAFINELLDEASIDTDRIENFAGKTDLLTLSQLIAGADAVLTTDSGPAHFANSLGVPTIALFGAGNEKNTGPYNKKDLTILRYGHLMCEPCVRNTCDLYGIPKCMQLLDEFKIINALSLYLI